MNAPHQPAAHAVTIRHIRSFLSVSRHRSFTRAAMELHVSQPSLTMAIRQLEDMVGARLFDRTTRTVELTPEAENFLPTAERLLGDFDIAIQDVRATARQRRGRISVASVHSVATKLLPGVLLQLADRHPSIQVRVRDGNSSDVRRRVRRNEVDLGFGSKDADEADLDFLPFFRDQLGLLLPRDHPLARGRDVLRWAELEGQVFVGLSSDTATAPLLGGIPHLPASLQAPRYEVSTNSTLWALLEGGLGITTTPALSAPDADSPLRFCRLEEPVVWRTVHTIRRRGRMLTAVSDELIEMLRESFRDKMKAGVIELLAG